MLMVLSPILKQGGLLWVQVATYQSVSGAGQSALDQFYQDSEQRLAALKQQKGTQVATDESFAFNVRPQIGAIEANGDALVWRIWARSQSSACAGSEGRCDPGAKGNSEGMKPCWPAIVRKNVKYN